MQIFEPPEDKTVLSEFSRTNGLQFGRCFAPFIDCDKPPIRAHSVQNSRILDMLQSKGHLIMLGMGLKNGGLEGGFRSVSRNQATTFLGLCSKHDSEIFARLDKGDLDPNDREVSFLLSWRSITHELHQNIEAGGKTQTLYAERIEAGLDSKDSPSPAGIEALSWMMTAFSTHEYREKYWNPVFQSQDYHVLRFKTYTLPKTGAALAASSLFSLEQQNREGEPVRATLNIWPTNEGSTIVQFGYTRPDTPVMAKFIRSLEGRKGQVDSQKLSAAVIMYVGNFVVAPSRFVAWPREKREMIEEGFFKNLHQQKSEIFPSPAINLFSVS